MKRRMTNTEESKWSPVVWKMKLRFEAFYKVQTIGCGKNSFRHAIHRRLDELMRPRLCEAFRLVIKRSTSSAIAEPGLLLSMVRNRCRPFCIEIFGHVSDVSHPFARALLHRDRENASADFVIGRLLRVADCLAHFIERERHFCAELRHQ